MNPLLEQILAHLPSDELDPDTKTFDVLPSGRVVAVRDEDGAQFLLEQDGVYRYRIDDGREELVLFRDGEVVVRFVEAARESKVRA